MIETLAFKTGDRVRSTDTGSSFYGGHRRLWVPPSQGGGSAGTITKAEYRGENLPGASPRLYMVKWDNGTANSYRVEDLEQLPAETVITIFRPVTP